VIIGRKSEINEDAIYHHWKCHLYVGLHYFQPMNYVQALWGIAWMSTLELLIRKFNLVDVFWELWCHIEEFLNRDTCITTMVHSKTKTCCRDVLCREMISTSRICVCAASCAEIENKFNMIKLTLMNVNP